jgi:GNAT superfamily N-acetyltransferase
VPEGELRHLASIEDILMRSSPGQSPRIDIELLTATAASDGELVSEITELVNRVYAAAEIGLWVEGAARATTAEMKEMIAGGEIAVARSAGRIVGSVRIQTLDERVGEFGVLVADPDHRSEGIGQKLVAFAEETCRRRGLRVMQLELLVPREWKHPSKEFLHAWYTRIGYRPVRSGTIDESYPRLAPLLATSCDYVVYHKDLAPAD